MQDPVFFELCFVDASNNIKGYLGRPEFDKLVKRWDERGRKPPVGESRYVLFDFVQQLEKAPLGTIRFELDAVVKVVELSAPSPKRPRRKGKDE
jgi:hypothetical protein